MMASGQFLLTPAFKSLPTGEPEVASIAKLPF